MTNLAQVASKTSSFVTMIGRLAAIEEKALPVLEIVAEFAPVPYLAAAIHVLEIVQPYATKVAQAAPVVVQAINDGGPIIAALQANGGNVLADFKVIYAIATNEDPNRPAGFPVLSPADVSDDVAAHFAGTSSLGRPWTDAEYQQSWGRAGNPADAP